MVPEQEKAYRKVTWWLASLVWTVSSSVQLGARGNQSQRKRTKQTTFQDIKCKYKSAQKTNTKIQRFLPFNITPPVYFSFLKKHVTSLCETEVLYILAIISQQCLRMLLFVHVITAYWLKQSRSKLMHLLGL